MLSANINLAMLWLHCLVQALAQSGCNCHYPKRHCLTLAMQGQQQFSNLLSPTGMLSLCKDIYRASQCAVLHHSWTDFTAACLGGDSSFLPHPTQPIDTPHHFPHSRQPWHGNYLFKAKTAENHVALFTFCLFCLPAWEKPQEDKIQGKKKQNQKHLSLATRSILLHIQSAIWPLQIFKKKINQTGALPDLSWHSHLTNTKITLMPACSLSKVSGGPLLLCQEIFYGNARMWKVFLLWSAYSLT